MVDLRSINQDLNRLADDARYERERSHDLSNGQYYKIALDDFKNGNIDENLWAKCQAHCNFNKNESIGLYVRTMAERLENR